MARDVYQAQSVTRVQGRHSFLVEYSGERSLGTTTNSCTGNLHSDMDNLSQCRWGALNIF